MNKIILLSEKEREQIQAQFSIEGYILLTDIVSLYEHMMSNPSHLIVTSNFIIDNVVDTEFVKVLDTLISLLNCNITIFAHDTDYVAFYYKDNPKVKIYNENITEISFNKLDLIYNNKLELEEAKEESTSLEDKLEQLEDRMNNVNKSEKDMRDTLKNNNKLLAKLMELQSSTPNFTVFLNKNIEAIKQFLTAYKYMDKLFTSYEINNTNLTALKSINEETISNYSIALNNTENKLKNMIDNYNTLLNHHNQLASKYNEYNTITTALKEYGTYNEGQIIDLPINTDDTNSIQVPIIILFKEYSMCPHFKTYFYALHKLIENNLNITTKNIIIDPALSNRLDVYKDYLNVVPYTDKADILENSHLLIQGHAYDLLSFLCKNDLKFDVILIWDRTCNTNLPIIGSYVQKFNLTTNSHIAKTLNLDLDDVICYDNKYSIPTIKHYDSLISKSEVLKSGVYSMLPITLEIFNIIKTYLS